MQDLYHDFRLMHRAPELLVLPNAWDAASARIFEIAGFRALGTTSAGIAASLGKPDGENVTLMEMLDRVEEIVDAVGIPVNADLERGYGETVQEIVESAMAAQAIGAAGINLEDSTGDPSSPLRDAGFQAEAIRALRESTRLVVNARTDALHYGFRVEEAIRRGNLYCDAGADCVFVPWVTDEGTIGRLARSLNGRLNVLAGKGTPPVARLRQLGVARVSLGSGPMRATLSLLRRIAAELKDPGSFELLTDGAMSYQEMNELFNR